MKSQMKKIICTATAVIMACSMAACGSKTLSAEELYAKALEAGNQDVEMDINSSTSTMGMTMDTTYNMKTKQDGDTIEFAMSGTIMGIEMNMYYVDGWMYMDMGEYGKSKVEADADTANEYFGQMSGSSGSTLLDADVSSFSELTVGEDEEGNTVLNYVLPADKVAEYMDAAYEELLGEDMEGITITYGDMTGTITFDDNNEMTKQTQSISMNMDMEGTSVDTESSMEYVIKAVGENVQITYPDFSDYEEIDSSEFFGE